MGPSSVRMVRPVRAGCAIVKDTNDASYGGGRCAACDKVFELDEVYWSAQRQEFESLCGTCRQHVRDALREMHVGSWEPER